MANKKKPDPLATEPLYRVWRPDCEDEEEEGRTYDAISVRDAARLYADYCHRNRDGWEWTWPIVFFVRLLPSAELFAISVDREMVPEFVPGKELSFEGMSAAHHLRYGMESLCRDPRLDGHPDRWPASQTYVEVKTIVEIDDDTQRQLAANEITCTDCRKRGRPLLARFVEARAQKKARDAEATS